MDIKQKAHEISLPTKLVTSEFSETPRLKKFLNYATLRDFRKSKKGKYLIIPVILTFLSLSCGGGENKNDAGEFTNPDIQQDMWRCKAEGEMTCQGNLLITCQREGEFIVQKRIDCEEEGLICIANPPLGCVLCPPGQRKCEDQDIYECSEDGKNWVYKDMCNPGKGEICVGGYCVGGCDNAVRLKSNVGCDYWPVDLDNAVVQGLNAAAQQYAVVVSNPSSTEAVVRVEENIAPPGEEPEVVTVSETILSPYDIDVFLLDPREVDGSTPTGENDGTGSAITANAYHLVSTAPIVAYQFNPLDNVNVFSNDASILLPSTVCDGDYIVLGWPQTIAKTGDPSTDMHSDLRAFLTIVGTDYETSVRIELPLNDRLRVLGDGNTIPDMIGGDTFNITLGPYEVLNLETDGFMADFTGTFISASKPIVVYSGSEASDVPTFDDLSTRLCCADHLEEQIYPLDRAGRRYVAAITPARTTAVKLAGGNVTPHEEKEYFKVLGIYDGTVIRTTLPTPDDVINLDKGESRVIESKVDFVAWSGTPFVMGQFIASQQVTGIPNDLPGGDPASVMVPPVEQWRKGYIFLTPSLYAFDFIIISHPPDASIKLDGKPFPPTCKTTPVTGAEENFEVTKCQLSFPEIIPDTAPPNNILPGTQNDGVHEILSDKPVGIVVYGFDNFVSYAYPGGTDLRLIE